jgi:uncharacterized integral membrane protein
MIRKILAAIVLVPLAIVIVGLAVANREVVSISFDPFNSVNPAFAIKAPLFILVLLLVIVGVFIGGVAAWLRQGTWRRTARRRDSELRAAHAEAEALRSELALRDEARSSEARTSTSIALRPPAA